MNKLLTLLLLIPNLLLAQVSLQSNDINGDMFYTNVNELITVSFPERLKDTMPTYNAISLIGSTTNSYVGNNVSFNLKCNSNNIANVRLILKGTSGRLWRNEYINIPTNAIWINNIIPLTIASGWTRDGAIDLNTLWNEDIQSVEYIGIRISQPDTKEVSYSLADFALVQDGVTNIITLTPLERALSDNFGIPNLDGLSEAQLAQDKDADGMSDVNEILSEYVKEFADSIFAVEIVSIDTGVNLKWACVNANKYSLIRTASLTNNFEYVSNATNLLATDTGYMYHTDYVTNQIYFYKVIRLGQ